MFGCWLCCQQNFKRICLAHWRGNIWANKDILYDQTFSKTNQMENTKNAWTKCRTLIQPREMEKQKIDISKFSPQPKWVSCRNLMRWNWMRWRDGRKKCILNYYQVKWVGSFEANSMEWLEEEHLWNQKHFTCVKHSQFLANALCGCSNNNSTTANTWNEHISRRWRDENERKMLHCIQWHTNIHTFERRNNVTLLIQAKLFVNMESQRNADNRRPTMPTIE